MEVYTIKGCEIVQYVPLASVSSSNHASKALTRPNLIAELQILNLRPQNVLFACPHAIEESNKYLKRPNGTPKLKKNISLRIVTRQLAKLINYDNLTQKWL